MSEEENTPDIPRFRKRKIISYAEYNTSLDISTPAAEGVSRKRVNKNNDSGFSNSYDNDSLVNNKQESGLTEYELIRLKNIEERRKLFSELNIAEVKQNFKITCDVKKGNSVPKKYTKVVYPPPRPKSLRLQNKTPSGELLPEKKKPEENVVVSLADYRVARKPSGPLLMTDTVDYEVDTDEIKKYMECFKPVVKEEPSYNLENKLSGDLEQMAMKFSKMTLHPGHIVKVVPHRIYSMAVHPSEANTLLAVGDKWGHVGLWNMQADESKRIQLFTPHSGPVNCTNFCVYNPAKVYSTSHDGTVRCGDMNRLVFDEIYSSDEDMAKNHTTWHCQTEESCLLVAHGNGDVALVDSRTANKTEGWYSCHERSVRTVQLHPLENKYFITSSTLGEVKIWDRRFINLTFPESVCTLQHPKGLTSAFFSPTGKFVVTACNDDRLRVFDVRDMNATARVISYINHNTHTGQWLTTFKANWHPQRDDLFIVGSMDHPRRILLYSSEGKRVYQLKDENLTSVCSICVFHPTQDIIFGGNSSGRVHVFM